MAGEGRPELTLLLFLCRSCIMEVSIQMNTKRICVRMNFDVLARVSGSRGEVTGKFLQFCRACSCGARRGKRRAQLQTEASASQIAPASVSGLSKTSHAQRKKKTLLAPHLPPFQPALIIHDVTSPSLFGFFFVFIFFFSLLHQVTPPHSSRPSLFAKH